MVNCEVLASSNTNFFKPASLDASALLKSQPLSLLWETCAITFKVKKIIMESLPSKNRCLFAAGVKFATQCKKQIAVFHGDLKIDSFGCRIHSNSYRPTVTAIQVANKSYD